VTLSGVFCYTWSDPVYTVTVSQPIGGGTIGANPAHGPAGTVITLTNSPAEDYTFSRYTVDGDTLNGDTFTLTKNVTVSGEFTHAETIYTVTVSQPANGGTIGADPTSGPAGTTITLTNSPAADYTFNRYIVDGDTLSGNTFTLAKDVIVSGEFTYTRSYTVTFDSNSGSGTPPMALTQVNAGAAIIIPGSNGLTKTDFSFGGWNTSTDGTGTNYLPESSYTPESNIILYAKWTEVPVFTTIIALSTLLSGLNVNTPATPVQVKINMDLQTGWENIVNAVRSAGRYVSLDLSGSTGMSIAGNYEWYDNDSKIISVQLPNTLTIIGEAAFISFGSLAEVSIGNNVTSIGDFAFGYCNSLANVILPDNVTTIGDYAFGYCSSLANMIIPGNVTTIGHFAFARCFSLKNMTIPDSVISIGDYAFEVCSSLTSVTIGGNVTSIGVAAFSCLYSLTSVTIPASVTSIGYSNFGSCTILTEINVASSNTEYSSIDGILYSKDQKTLIVCPNGKTGTVSIPNSVTSIGDNAFLLCTDITSVTMGNNVTSIGNWAFAKCYNLTNVNIPTSVVSIGDYAFTNCESFTIITVPNNVASIGEAAFMSCDSLVSLSIGNSVTSMGMSAFRYCYRLVSVTIPNSVSSIGGAAFGNCNVLAKVTFEGTITADNFLDSVYYQPFPGDLLDKYLASGIGTYTTTRDGNGNDNRTVVWMKQ
jgi:hypothetical protein